MFIDAQLRAFFINRGLDPDSPTDIRAACAELRQAECARLTELGINPNATAAERRVVRGAGRTPSEVLRALRSKVHHDLDPPIVRYCS